MIMNNLMMAMMINHRLRRILQGIFWVLVYIFLTILPVLVMFLPPRPPGREFIREFSVALGFVGLAMMALQFALTARFKTIKAPYGADVVYHFHRQISILAFILILIHPILLFIPQIHPVSILNIFSPATPLACPLCGHIPAGSLWIDCDGFVA